MSPSSGGEGRHHLDEVVVAQVDAAHAGGDAAHRSGVALVEADAHAVVGAEEDVAVAVGQLHREEVVALVDAIAMMPVRRMFA